MFRVLFRSTKLATAFAVAATALAATASASNAPDARLDQLATKVAGHPVSVWCESSWQDWVDVERLLPGSPDLYGFTIPTHSNVVYLQPTVCETLHVLLANNYYDTGDYWTAIAIHTLVHESLHQKGFADEGATDCAALALDPSVDAQFVPETYTSSKWVRMKKRLVRRKVTAANPDFARLVSWQHWFHNNAFPPEYRGGCS
jgi:hypothetical protein